MAKLGLERRLLEFFSLGTRIPNYLEAQGQAWPLQV